MPLAATTAQHLLHPSAPLPPPYGARTCMASSSGKSMSARAAASAYDPPEPIAMMPLDGSMTSPLPAPRERESRAAAQSWWQGGNGGPCL